VRPRFNPPFFADTRAAWEGWLPESPGMPIRIEAAAYRAHPVSFQIVEPWTSAPQSGVSRSGSPTGDVERYPALFAATTAVLVAGGLFFARRNLRLGRSDRAGATRLMFVVLTASFFAWLLIEHHVGTVGEGVLFTMFAGIELPLAGSLWLYYVALEPFVRRQWPQILVSWTRLLSGNWRDPLVGRDLLIGCAAGVATLCLILFFAMIALRTSGAPLGLLTPDWNMLNGVGSFVGAVFTQFGNGVFGGLASLLALFLLRVALRSDWRAGAAYAAVRGLPFAALAVGISWPVLPLGLAIGILSYFVIMRVGFVAAMTSSIVVYLLLLSPLTLQPSAWYAGIGFVLIAIVLAVSAYGFAMSLGGRMRVAAPCLDV
jgi:hypothetical protein